MTFFQWVLGIFVYVWRSEDSFDDIFRSGEPDLLVPISFTTLRTRLVDGTRENVTELVRWFHFCKIEPVVAFSSCSYPFAGSELVEDDLREEMLKKHSIEPIKASGMINTVDEAYRIREKLSSEGWSPKRILVITGELHSRSARYVWRKVFPDARVYIRCIPYTNEVQEDHLVKNQRQMWTWVRSNILRQTALRLLPLERVRKIQHRPVETP